MTIKLTINGKRHALNVEPDMPLLWALRDELKMTGKRVRALPIKNHSFEA